MTYSGNIPNGLGRETHTLFSESYDDLQGFDETEGAEAYVIIASPAGSLFKSELNMDGNHPGIERILLDITGANNRAGVRQTIDLFDLDDDDLTWECCVKVDPVPSVGEPYRVELGVSSNTGPSAHTDACYFFLDEGSANWMLRCAAASTTTEVDSGIAATTGWVHLKIIASSSRVRFYIDDVFAGELTTNIPTTHLTSTVWTRAPAGTGSGTVDVLYDYIYWRKDFGPEGRNG